MFYVVCIWSEAANQLYLTSSFKIDKMFQLAIKRNLKELPLSRSLHQSYSSNPLDEKFTSSTSSNSLKARWNLNQGKYECFGKWLHLTFSRCLTYHWDETRPVNQQLKLLWWIVLTMAQREFFKMVICQINGDSDILTYPKSQSETKFATQRFF